MASTQDTTDFMFVLGIRHYENFVTHRIMVGGGTKKKMMSFILILLPPREHIIGTCCRRLSSGLLQNSFYGYMHPEMVVRNHTSDVVVPIVSF